MSKKTVIITGGARGLGKAGAERFLKSGTWKVALFDMQADLLAKAAEDLGGRYGKENVTTAVCDVTNLASVSAAVNKVIAEFGGVDCLINNAGITRDAMSWKMEEKDFDAVVGVNLKGAFNCGRAVINHMREKKAGSIINTSSVVGLYGNVGQTNYAATKWGVIGMTKTWAKELGRSGVRVNAVAPGYTLTEMVQTVPEKILTSIAEKTPLQRLGKPEDIANAYYFLANDDAAFITGAVLAVDGGLVI
ncbi:MAG: 3-oxoacyl-ACP reductase FabG [Elusimicrobiales bacterium]